MLMNKDNRSSAYRRREFLQSVAFLTPSVLGVMLFFVIPFGIVVYYAVMSSPFNGEFVFLDNFISLVQNLVTNAVKYGKDGGHVWVKVYSEGSKACVSVRDDGIGIGVPVTGYIDRVHKNTSFYSMDN